MTTHGPQRADANTLGHLPLTYWDTYRQPHREGCSETSVTCICGSLTGTYATVGWVTTGYLPLPLSRPFLLFPLLSRQRMLCVLATLV